MSSGTNSVKVMPENITIQVPATAWNDLLMKVARLERYIMVQERETMLKGLAALEDTFNIERTREKRIR